MRRRLLGIVTIISFGLLVVAAITSVPSHNYFLVKVPPPGTNHTITFSLPFHGWPIGADRQAYVSGVRSILGFHHVRFVPGPIDRTPPSHLVIIPAWALLLTFALLPAHWLRHELVRRRAAIRRRQGQCPSCGYDLRASPGPCPECGQAT